MKSWQAPIPQKPKNKHIKRCYTVWTRWTRINSPQGIRAGGKVVWMTDTQLTFACIKYPNKEFELVLERDRLEEYKKYMHQTIE